MQHLELYFSNSFELKETRELGLGLEMNTGLQYLHLDFCTCMGISDIAALGQGVGKLQGLLELQLVLSECSEVIKEANEY